MEPGLLLPLNPPGLGKTQLYKAGLRGAVERSGVPHVLQEMS